MLTIDWDLIIGSIQEEKCVLFLGPEITLFEEYKDKTLIESLLEYLDIDNNEKIGFHRNDEFFIFGDKGSEFSTYFKIKKFYSLTFEEEAYKLLAQIPFHLIVTITPDLFLKKTFDKYDLPYKFDYYHKKQNPREIETPKASNPQIYNLFGVIDQKESIVLTHDDMFIFLHSILGKNELPKELIETMKSAYSFVFLGFKFDKWYVQLILRLLHLYDDDRRNKYASSSKVAEDLQDFFKQQFNISFVSNNILEFVQTLYDRCKNAQNETFQLRKLGSKKLSEDDIALIDTMMQIIGENKIDETIQQLKEFAKLKNDRDLMKQAVVISGRFHSVNEQIMLDIIASDEAHLELNKIRHSLVEIISSLK